MLFSPNDDSINDHFTVYGDVPNIQLIEQLIVFQSVGRNCF